MSTLPTSWKQCALGEVIDYGVTKKAEPDEIPDKAWVLELEDIEKDSSKILQRLTFAERQSKSTKNRFETGDVLYGKLRPYLNKVVRADQAGYCTTEIIPLKANEAIHASYLFHWLKHPTFLEYVTAVSHGLNMPRLGTDSGKKAPFVLAPLPEQKRIADKLDAVLARVDACRDRLDRVPAILKRFRQSVLAAAISGQLTEDWREQNESSMSAEELVSTVDATKSGLLRVRAAEATLGALDLFTLPDNWAWISNSRLAKDSSTAICAGPFGTIFKAKDFRDYGIPIVFLRHVGEGRYLTHKPGFMDEEVWKADHQPYSIFGGELLVTKLGDPPGTACIYPEGLGTAMVTPDVIKMDVDSRVAMTNYLMYFFNSMACKDLVGQLAFGVTRLRIDIAMFKNFPIPLPPRDEQTEIVRRVESLFAWADRLEARLKSAKGHADRLTPALLAKAFRGELVPQDPADEPAASLLARLAANQSDNAGIPRRRRRAGTAAGVDVY